MSSFDAFNLPFQFNIPQLPANSSAAAVRDASVGVDYVLFSGRSTVATGALILRAAFSHDSGGPFSRADASPAGRDTQRSPLTPLQLARGGSAPSPKTAGRGGGASDHAGADVDGGRGGVSTSKPVGVELLYATLLPLQILRSDEEAQAAGARADSGAIGIYPNITLLAGALVLSNQFSSVKLGAMPLLGAVGNVSIQGQLTFASLVSLTANGTIRVIGRVESSKTSSELSGVDAPYAGLLALRSTGDVFVESDAFVDTPALHIFGGVRVVVDGNVFTRSLASREPCEGTVLRPTCAATVWSDDTAVVPPPSNYSLVLGTSLRVMNGVAPAIVISGKLAVGEEGVTPGSMLVCTIEAEFSDMEGTLEIFGCPGGTGWGAGLTDDSFSGGGASHCTTGGASATGCPVGCYGSVYDNPGAPLYVGSGGGGASIDGTFGGEGGGYVYIHAALTSLDSTTKIDAGGGDAQFGGGGGGSGGTILLSTNSLVGDGIISVGGGGGTVSGGGGSGGAIVLSLYNTNGRLLHDASDDAAAAALRVESCDGCDALWALTDFAHSVARAIGVNSNYASGVVGAGSSATGSALSSVCARWNSSLFADAERDARSKTDDSVAVAAVLLGMQARRVCAGVGGVGDGGDALLASPHTPLKTAAHARAHRRLLLQGVGASVSVDPAADFSGKIIISGGLGEGEGMNGAAGVAAAPPCPAGYALDAQSLSCLACSVGTWRNASGPLTCVACANKPDRGVYGVSVGVYVPEGTPDCVSVCD